MDTKLIDFIFGRGIQIENKTGSSFIAGLFVIARVLFCLALVGTIAVFICSIAFNFLLTIIGNGVTLF